MAISSLPGRAPSIRCSATIRPPSLRMAITTSHLLRAASASAAAIIFLASSSVITGFILMVPSLNSGDDLVGVVRPDKELARSSLAHKFHLKYHSRLQHSAPPEPPSCSATAGDQHDHSDGPRWSASSGDHDVRAHRAVPSICPRLRK